VSTVFIVLTGVFGLLAFVCALLSTISFSKGHRKKYPILTRFDGKKLHSFSVAVICAAIAYGSNIGKDLFTNPVVGSVPGRHGEFTQKATLTGFERELKEASDENERKARDYFKAAEHDIIAQRYPDAAINYQKSINLLPTMSGYLNLGIVLGYTSSFRSWWSPAASAMAFFSPANVNSSPMVRLMPLSSTENASFVMLRTT
jgi:hypothetical protein